MEGTRLGRTTLPLIGLVAPGAAILLLGAAAGGLQTRATQPHVAVVLKDEGGNPVDPNAAAPRPYSPRQTCGGCHPYDKITQAYHFTMGADVMSDDWGAKNRNRR